MRMLGCLIGLFSRERTYAVPTAQVGVERGRALLHLCWGILLVVIQRAHLLVAPILFDSGDLFDPTFVPTPVKARAKPRLDRL